jgi:hypothetical protein
MWLFLCRRHRVRVSSRSTGAGTAEATTLARNTSSEAVEGCLDETAANLTSYALFRATLILCKQLHQQELDYEQQVEDEQERRQHIAELTALSACNVHVSCWG